MNPNRKAPAPLALMLDRNGRMIAAPADPQVAIREAYRSLSGSIETRNVITNANSRLPYRTGDGDVMQPPRPGSLDAFTKPSLINGERRAYRGVVA